MWGGVSKPRLVPQPPKTGRNLLGFVSDTVKFRAGCYFICFVGLVLLIACQNTPPVVKIGLVGPFEGAHREIGYDVIYSARLAVRQINEAGGIGGYRLALVALDDSGQVEMAQETAESLLLDPAVVAVMGNWLPETTAVAQPLFIEAGMSFLVMGEPPFGVQNPAELPADFRAAYEAITPFDEVAGPYAGSTYAAFQLLWATLEKTAAHGPITRETVLMAFAPEQ